MLTRLTLALVASSVVASTAVLANHHMESAKVSPALKAAVAAKTRTPANVARDRHRNPAETLAFFGIKPTHTVVEIWPGGGWYTEILAPYLAGQGKLIVAPPTGQYAARYLAKLDADPATYGKLTRANFPAALGGTPVAPGTADAVVTFRNVHNWRMGSGSPDKADYSEAAFRELFAMLKPGGVLGIEDHRLPDDADAERERSSGYIKVSTVRAMAEKVGFRFVASSEINANPRDTKDYPKGVWTLSPNFVEGDTDRAKFAAIGESDRMTLKFVKPAS
ncbi:MAG: class I SAM-dependent methyltransferase [Sphingomonadaceae bacterium]